MQRSEPPKYLEISDHYEHSIRSGKLQAGHLFLGERELATLHKTTRKTVRKAFNILLKKGLVIKRRPQGTFVARTSLDRSSMRVAVIIPAVYRKKESIMPAGPDISSSSYLMIDLLAGELGEHGLALRIYHVDTGWEKMPVVANHIHEQGEAAIIGIGLELAATDVFGELRLPAVFVDSYLGKHKYDSIRPDDREGAKQATRHVLRTAKKPLIFVGMESKDRTIAANLRYRGFVDAHREKGLSVRKTQFLHPYEHSAKGGEDIVSRILRLPDLPGGIICSSDAWAFIIMNGLERNGIKVPLETQVTGFGDSLYCMMTVPPITSVAPDRKMMCKKAVELLERRLKEPGCPPRSVNVSTLLKWRQSTLLKAN